MFSRQPKKVKNKTYSKEQCHPENPRFESNKKRVIYMNCDISTILQRHHQDIMLTSDDDLLFDDDFQIESKYHKYCFHKYCLLV